MSNYENEEWGKVDDGMHHFKKFAVVLENNIAKYPKVSKKQLFETQKRQMENLVELERQYRETLANHERGDEIYGYFLRYIREERKNILSSRPFFRERAETFTEEISVAFKANDIQALKKFHVNYPFVLISQQKLRCNEVPELVELAKKIKAQRDELVITNMPLAINRARMFWNKTPRSQLSYMDLVQIACEGLMSAIDKYCLPFRSVFRSVAIGRMVGNFIENYSETLVHFFPADRRKLYRANKNVGRLGGMADADYDVLADRVNDGVTEAMFRTTASELVELMQAASCVSLDAFTMPSLDPSDERSTSEDSGPKAADELRPDAKAEQRELAGLLQRYSGHFTMLEKKVLVLKGLPLVINQLDKIEDDGLDW
jgi:DNA-directed RNA polymerase specialized sigma subunit